MKNLFSKDVTTSRIEGLDPSPVLSNESSIKGASYDEMFSPDTLALPRLPWLMQKLTDLEEEPEFKKALLVSLLPILGALATGVRFRYYDGEEHSFTFMTCIQGETSSGKSFVKRYVELLTEPFLEEEDRIGPQSTSTTALCRKIEQAMGKHLFTFYSELAQLVEHMKRGAWANLSPFFCSAFDNDVFRQEMISNKNNTWSGEVRLLLNALATGTPRACRTFFNAKSIEAGMQNRWLITQMPDRFGLPMRRVHPITEELQYEIGYVAMWLKEQSDTISFPPLLNAIEEWVNTKGQEARAMASKAVDEFRKRSAVNGFRAGMLCFLLEQERQTLTSDEIVKFGLWVAEYAFRNHMKLYGEWVDSDALNKQLVNGHKVPYMLPKLPKQFTRDDVSKLQVSMGNSNPDPKQNISYWKKLGCIKELVKGQLFEKVV